MPFGNLKNLFSGSPRDRELRETRASFDEVERLWRASPLGQKKSYEISHVIMIEALDRCERRPAWAINEALYFATDDIFETNDITQLEIQWDLIEQDAALAVGFREMLVRRRRWVADFEGTFTLFKKQMAPIWDLVFQSLPEACFSSFRG